MRVNSLDLAKIFADDARDLTQARKKGIQLHSTNIRASGGHIESTFRSYLKRMLPPRYHVTNGHLIDQHGQTSPHFDVIISDNFSMPSLLTTQEETEYIPASSALVIGEIKSTYYHTKRYFDKFFHDLEIVNSRLNRPLIENTYQGEISLNTTISDIVTASSKKYHNSLYSFFLCIDKGDFEFSKIAPFLKSARI